MVIYFHNQHAEPLAAVLRDVLHAPLTEAETRAVQAVLDNIRREQEGAQHQIWLKSQPTQEKSA